MSRGRRVISQDEWNRLDEMVDGGVSIAEAARRVGIHRVTASKHRSGVKDVDGKKAARLRRDDELPAPVVGGDLLPEAAHCLECFACFRLRYFGHVSTPWQIDAANRAVALVESPEKEHVVVNVPPGAGKALALDTPLLTTRGWTTMKDVQPGDEVYGADGRPTLVIAKSEVFYGHDCYEVTSDDGASVVADADHLWSVRLHGHGQYKAGAKPDYAGKTGPKPSPDGRHVHTTEFLARKRSKRPQVQIADSLDLPDAALLIDPYVMGVWLGDGNSAGARFTSHPDDAPFVVAQIEAAGYAVERMAEMRYSVTGSRKWARDGLATHLRQLDLINNKHVPEQYLLASAPQRLALLQGLVDTDGSVDMKGRIEFCSTNRALADGVRLLARSLGVKASLKVSRATIEGRDCGERYRVNFQHPYGARLPRKAERCRSFNRNAPRYLTVTLVESVPTQCIQVAASDGLFLAGEGLLVTHNSTLFTHDIPAWIIARDRSKRVLIGSRTERQARQYVGRLKTSFERTQPPTASDDQKRKGLAVDAVATLTGDFGRFKPTNPDVWRNEEFTVAQVNDIAGSDKERTVSAYGMDGGFLGGRYDVVVWDDLVDKRTLRTADAREQLITMWETEAETRLEPGGLLILQGQRMRGDDLYRYALDLKAGDPDEYESDEDRPNKYHHIIYRAHDDANCKGLHAKTDPAWTPDGTGGCLLDPQRLDWRSLKTIQANRAERYLVMYQQEDTDPSNALVHKVWVSGGLGEDGVEYPGCWDRDRGLAELPKGLTGQLVSVATADPSPTRFWSIQWWIYHPDTEQRFLMDIMRCAMDAPDFLDWDYNGGAFTGVMEEWQQRSKDRGLPITHWVVEANAAQRFILQYDHAKRWQRKHSVDVIPHQTHRNKTDPEFGVQSIAPHWRFGRIRLPGKVNNPGRIAAMKLVDEVTQWPDGSTDDCVMASWFFEVQLPNIFMPDAPPVRIHAGLAGHRRLELVPA